ncbi:MAG: flippase-like domain-containing protein [Actinobacteria bacterium]|nr:flippase-like domain-containing protein [Actinomycetota bacterium]
MNKKKSDRPSRSIPAIRQHIFSIIKFFVSAGLILWLLQRIGIQNVGKQISHANWVWILASILTFSSSNLLGAFQWYLLLRIKGIRLSFWRVVSYYHVGLFFNNFLIGYVGGDAFRIYDVQRSSGDTMNAFSTVLFDRFVGFFTLTMLALIVSLVWIKSLASLVTILTIAVIFFGWIFGILFFLKLNIARKMSWLLTYLLPTFVTDKLRDIYFEINRFRHNKKMLLRIFVISLVVQSLRVCTHILTARAVGVHVNAIYFFVFVPIIAMAASLPISLGGIGVREQSGVTLFAQAGVPSTAVVVFEFLAYLVGVVATIPGGIIFALRKEKFHTRTDKQELV